MATALPIVPLVSKQRLMGAISLFRPEGSQRWLKIGPTDTAEFTPAIETVDSSSAETGLKKLIRKYTTGTTATLNLTGVQMWTEFLYSVLYLSQKKYLTQEAVVSATLELDDVTDGFVFDLPARKPAITSITNGDEENPKSLAVGTDFIFSSETRFGELKKLPADFGNKAVITYSAPAITETEALLDLDIMSISGIRGEYQCIGMTADGNGDPVSMYLPSVEFRPNGASSVGDAANLNTGTIQADVYQDSNGSYGRLEGRRKIIEA
ncbi:hypothetical protein [Rhizobium leguminosarum]|uniref:hypothetical protein n=1 Tax=Rhizobium leguminosarum TaxID=384 RepID=UPI00144196BE|nr:hypothetical protein [Rhizobium leguminosarum]NKL63296.1 hypothetical protein [Rhizobium leguminosarum bv. viciae]